MRALLVFLFVLSATVTQAWAERRVALVIGNSAYEKVAALDNPRNDATAISSALSNLGFEVVQGIDLDRRGMQGVLREFSEALIGADVAMFYYAGHGIQVNGTNYLIPVDAELRDETDLDFATVEFDLIMNQMEREPRVKLLFLDACRDNPFKAQLARSMTMTRATGRVADGLAEINVNASAGGTLLAFATDPGALAMDGTGDTHSPFTKALLDHITRPGLEIHEMMIDVRSDVWETTRKRQRPWSNSSLIGKFYFSTEVEEAAVVLAMSDNAEQPAAPAVPQQPEPQAQAPAPAPSAADPVQAEIELELWRAVSEGNSVAEYQVYLDQYPAGKFAALAKARIAKLQGQVTPRPPLVAQGNAGATKGLTPIVPGAEVPVTPSATAPMAELPPESQEEALGLNRNARRELQRRLKLAGHNPGGADGMLGPRSRQAISGWQAANGHPVTGYFTSGQIAALSSETEVEYQALMAEIARQSRTRKQVSSARTRTRQHQSTQPQQQQERKGSHLGSAFRKIGHGVRDIFR